jgi:hypothetical protein
MVFRHREYKPEDDVRETPPAFFASLHRQREYTIDACALPKNTKLPLFYSPQGLTQLQEDGTPLIVLAGVDGLSGPYDGQRVWCNPPFSQFDEWLPWAWRNSAAELITMLVPATRTDRPWWHKWVEPYRDNLPERRGTAAQPGPYEGVSKAGWRLHVDYLPGRFDFLEDGHPVWRRDSSGALVLKSRGPNKGKPTESTAMFGCALLEWRHHA